MTPADAGTPSHPKPARIGFGYQVGTTDGTRPAFTTDYIIGLGAGIRATHDVRDARTGRRIWPECPQRRASTNSCPSSTKLGSGIVDNLAGSPSRPDEKIP
ncbi:MAG: hypothetical protein M3141_08775, partial [Actinomycetota bacterium]|nr:hypothetical protein [Actinomycetota bacterium]